MAPSITQTILRRRKTVEVEDKTTETVIPIRTLPYELQLLIAQECVLTPIPIVVGKTIARWLSDPSEDREARLCSAMLRVSKDFREELYRMYYQNNVFELGYYYDQNNFFNHPGKDLVRFVLVDALRVLIRPAGVPNTILSTLKTLPSLQQVSIRLRGSLLHNSVLYEASLAKFLVELCRALKVKKVELLIEPSLGDTGIETVLQDYQDFLAESMTAKEIWPKGIPNNRSMVQFQASWENVSAAGMERLRSQPPAKAPKTGGKQMKTLLRGLRRASASSTYFDQTL